MSLLRMLLVPTLYVAAIALVLGPAGATPPPPAGPVSAQATPAPTAPPRNTVASLRKQGYRPAILLAGDLFLLLVGLGIVIAGMRQRPRKR